MSFSNGLSTVNLLWHQISPKLPLHSNSCPNGKAPGLDGIPTEVYKLGSQKLVRRLTVLFNNIGNKDAAPQDFKDANIIHLYNKQGTLPFVTIIMVYQFS